MAKRYIGDAVVTIVYKDDFRYIGTISAGGHVWKFNHLNEPFSSRLAADSSESYDRAAASAVAFGGYYTTHNRGDDLPDWAPPAEVADAISEATVWATDDKGRYHVRRSLAKNAVGRLCG